MGLNWIWQGRSALKRMNRDEQDRVRAQLRWAELKQFKAGLRLAEQVGLGLENG